MAPLTPLIKPIQWCHGHVKLLDQRRLPTEELYVRCEDYQAIADAIRTLAVRGAPAIGVAAAFGMALGAQSAGVAKFAAFREKLLRVGEQLIATRPTAVNLRWAVERMQRVMDANQHMPISALTERLVQEALAIYEEDLQISLAMGAHGAALINSGDHVLTHCNAGALATAGFGTALAVLYRANEEGKRVHVYVDETRPFLQGARLTAWELQKYGMEITVICDNMAGFVMQQKKIDKIFVGADRIAANGDVANKIGTYSLAVLAKHHNIPMYIVAPYSTFDLATPTGAEIPIEERDPREITHIGNVRLTPEHVNVYNPSFDITPNELITAVITDRGIATAPYTESLATLVG